MTKTPARKPATKRNVEAAPPLLEWVVSGFGLLIVIAVLGVLLFEVLSGPDRPADIGARVTAIEPADFGWRVEAEAVNAGDAAAAQVRIVGTLEGAHPETAEVTLDYLPGAGNRTFNLYFRSDPRSGALSLSAVGWIDP